MQFPKLCNWAGKIAVLLKCHRSWCRRPWEVSVTHNGSWFAPLLSLGSAAVSRTCAAQVGWGGAFPRSHYFLFESGLESYEPNLEWLHSTYRPVGRRWGLAANSSGLRCGLATPYSPSEFASLLHLYWANGGCGREDGGIMPRQGVAQKAHI